MLHGFGEVGQEAGERIAKLYRDQLDQMVAAASKSRIIMNGWVKRDE